jgi:hypothetical protein
MSSLPAVADRLAAAFATYYSLAVDREWPWHVFLMRVARDRGAGSNGARGLVLLSRPK